jgi:hypothetical protein
MMKTTHPLADDYLRRFEHSARVLPRSEQKELVGSIRDHLDAAIAPDATEADVRNVLDDLGEPADIVAAAQPGRAPARRGAREAFAVILLALGLPPILGWLVGVGLLLSSPLWTARQKALGILVWPGGLSLLAVGAALALTVSAGVAAPIGTIVMIVVIFAPIFVAAYLYRAAGRRADAA